MNEQNCKKLIDIFFAPILEETRQERLSTRGRSRRSILFTFRGGREGFLWWEDAGWTDAKTRPTPHQEEFRIQAHNVSSYTSRWDRCAAMAHSQAKWSWIQQRYRTHHDASDRFRSVCKGFKTIGERVSQFVHKNGSNCFRKIYQN